MEVHGGNDWAWGHNRLWGGSITLDYDIPIAEIRAKDPEASFWLRSSYFGGWGTEGKYPVETYVNCMEADSVEVPGEHQGRTYRDINIDEFLKQ